MPDADRRVCDHFAAKDSKREIDHLAFASYAFAKFEWRDRFGEQQSREPTAQEADRWVLDLPDSRLDEIHEAAGEVFRTAAREYMSGRIKAMTDEAVYKLMVAEVTRHNETVEANVRRLTSVSANLLPNILYGILSSAIFAAIIILASLTFTRDPSPLALYKSLAPSGPASAGTEPPPTAAPSR